MLATVKVSGDTRFDLQMFPPVSLRGRVLDPKGKPAEGIVVKLTGAPETMTNEEGASLIEDVPPGLWKLSATPVEAELKDEERVATTYYPPWSSPLKPSQFAWRTWLSPATTSGLGPLACGRFVGWWSTRKEIRSRTQPLCC